MELEKLVIKLDADASGLTSTIQQIKKQIDKTTKETKKEIDPGTLFNNQAIKGLGDKISKSLSGLKNITPKINTKPMTGEMQKVKTEFEKTQEQFTNMSNHIKEVMAGGGNYEEEVIDDFVGIYAIFEKLETKIKAGTASLGEFLYYVEALKGNIPELEGLNLDPEDRYSVGAKGEEQQIIIKEALAEYQEKYNKLLEENERLQKKAQRTEGWKKFGNTVSKIASTISKPFKKLWESFKSKVKQISGMLSQAFVFGVLSQAINGISNSFKNIIKNTDSLQASLSRLKGSFLTAVQPILDVLIPALEKVLDLLAKVFNWLATITTTITGKTIKATQEEAKETEALAKAGSTQSFDELNQVGSSDSSISATFTEIEESEEEQLSLFDKINNGIDSLFEKIENGLTKFKDKLLPSVLDGVADLGTTLGNVLNNVVTLLDNIRQTILTYDFGSAIMDSLMNFTSESNGKELGKEIYSLIESAVDFVQGLIEELSFSDIFDFIFGVVTGIIEKFMTGDLINNLTELIATVVTKLSTIAPQLITSLFNAIINFVVDSANYIIESIQEKGFVQTILDLLYKFIVEPVANIFKGLWNGLPEEWKEALTTAWESVSAWFEEHFSGLVEWFSDVGEKIKNVWNTVCNAIDTAFIATCDWIKNAWTKVKDWFCNVVTNIKNFFANFGENMKKIWNTVVAVLVTAWTNFKDKIESIINKIKLVVTVVVEAIKKAWTDAIDKIKSAVTTFKETVQTVFNNIKNGILKIVDKIKDGWKNMCNWISEKWEAMGNGIKDFFKGIVNGILGFFNGIISGFETAINFVIKAINKIRIDNDALNIHIGFNLDEVSLKRIPLLAKGGIVNQATPLIAGEAGAEAIVPLENNTEWMYKLAEIINSRKDNGNSKIVLTVDGKEFGQVAVKTINNITKQSGKLPLVLA